MNDDTRGDRDSYIIINMEQKEGSCSSLWMMPCQSEKKRRCLYIRDKGLCQINWDTTDLLQ